MDKWPGVDEALCEVCRKVVNGTLADFGRLNDPYEVRGKGKCAERRRNMLMLAAAGMTDEEVAVETGFTIDTVRYALYGTRKRPSNKEKEMVRRGL